MLSSSSLRHGFVKFRPLVMHTIRCVSLDSTGSDNTVISRCTKKINDSLFPTKIEVTASNDDPNGSHVCYFSISLHFTDKK